MKKILWLIVCLMTITMTFSSCSKDDEQKEEEIVNISGTWADENNELFYYFYYGILDIKDAEASTLQMRYQYSVNGNEMFWSLPNTTKKEKKTEIEKKRIKEIEEELKNARGSRREHLIDMLNDEIGGNKEDDKVSFHIIIVKLTSTELFLQVPNVGIRKLYRKKENNF